MANFFIARPIFAWVVAIFIAIGGAIAIPMLPVSQYPTIAPPQVSITATYPGASSEELYQGVTRLIEEELNGIKGLMYYESTSEASGLATITATFSPGTPISQATVDVQNRVRRVEARLPRPVAQQGVIVDEASSSFLLVVSLTSTDGAIDDIGLGVSLSP